MQKMCSSFQFGKKLLAAKVSAEVLQHEMPKLHQAFRLKSMDLILLEVAESCPWPFDLSVIPEIRGILDRSRAHMDEHEQAKTLELRCQLMTATFESLRADLCTDDKALTKHWELLSEKRASSEVRVVQHKRRRYALGLKRVREFMAARLKLGPDTFQDAGGPEHNYIADFAGFKLTLEAQLPPGTTVCGSQLCVALVVSCLPDCCCLPGSCYFAFSFVALGVVVLLAWLLLFAFCCVVALLCCLPAAALIC
jgi:hypothetical protein